MGAILTEAGITCLEDQCHAEGRAETFTFSWGGRVLEVQRFGTLHQDSIDGWAGNEAFWGAEVIVGKGWGIAYHPQGSDDSQITLIRDLAGDGVVVAELVNGEIVTHTRDGG